MRINDDNKGNIEIDLVKAETSILLQAAYLCERVARNVDGPAGEMAKVAAANSRAVARMYGAKYLDEDGNLLEKQSAKRDESEAPRGAAEGKPEGPPRAETTVAAASAGHA